MGLVPQNVHRERGPEPARGSAVVREFNQVLVWVAHVQTADGSGCAGLVDGTFLDIHAGRRQDACDLFDRIVDHETQVSRSRLRVQRLRLELVTGRMQIDLAAAEGQRMASVVKNGVSHTEHADVELDGRVEVSNGENEMVEPIDT